MCAVRDPYHTSLNHADIISRRSRLEGGCNWYSTVYGPNDYYSMDSFTSFYSSYWAENLTRPVLFSQAIATAVKEKTFGFVLEVGPPSPQSSHN
ncbi:hypothetical protein M426DRAFT_267618 [Hypoxylon sp. CI-4A]|nr:hypothetical protein M426DRAFT_267618 [Hypoxylon sp. CI-4A]